MLFSVMPKTVCSMLEESVNYSRQKSTVIPTFVLYFFFLHWTLLMPVLMKFSVGNMKEKNLQHRTTGTIQL